MVSSRGIEAKMLTRTGTPTPEPRALSDRGMTRMQRKRLRLVNANGELFSIGVEERAQIGIARLLEPIGEPKRLADDGHET